MADKDSTLLAETILQGLANQSLIGIAILKEWRFVFANRAFLDIGGQTMEELSALTPDEIQSLIHAEDREMAKSRYAERSSGTPVIPRYEIRTLHKDGRIVCLEVYSQRIDHEGSPAVLIVTIDATERRRADEALRESQAMYSALLEQAGDAVFILQDRRFVYVNPATERIFGFPAAALLALEDLSPLLPQRLRSEVGERHARRLRGEKVPDLYEAEITNRSGAVVPVEIRVSTITYKGRPAVLAIVRDISERRRLEDERNRIQRLESLGHLAGGIAHDFNNILTAILGNIHLAGRSLDRPDEAARILEEASRAASMARDVASQLLTFSKGGAPVKKHLHLDSLLRRAAEMAVAGSGIRCSCVLDDDVRDIEADPGQLTQVIGNVVLNAVQSAPRDGEIRIRAQNADVGPGEPGLEPGPHVRIVIEDRGCGIARDVLPKIFDPYFSTKTDGFGLGLTTVHSIVKRHGGSIDVASTPGEGTTVTVTLPAMEGRARGKEAGPAALEPGKARILFMDDEGIVRGTVVKLLARLGYVVAETSDGREAVELFRREHEAGRPFDAVILDLVVPGGVGGREAIGEIRRIDPSVRAVVSSGYSDDPVLACCRDFGFDDAIAKPFGVEELALTLSRLLA
jgi:two-component system cell cycle sensor histidine kinase/response regulator CckA